MNAPGFLVFLLIFLTLAEMPQKSSVCPSTSKTHYTISSESKDGMVQAKPEHIRRTSRGPFSFNNEQSTQIIPLNVPPPPDNYLSAWEGKEILSKELLAS